MMQSPEKRVAWLPRVFISISLCCLFVLMSVPMTFAKDADPLRPADTSSPRDTLHGFLSDTSQTIEDFRKDKRTDETYQALRRASQTLDFSSTPEGDSWFVRNRRIALLQELLARIELPPANQIPGDREVADGKIDKWTIPNTRITITKITQGPRAGQFLFSANSVQQLESLYRQAKHLPYQPGATVGIYEELISGDSWIQNQEQQLRERLKAVNTSSPRATLEDFLDTMNRAYVLITEADAALQARPPTKTREEARKIEKMATSLLQRASDTLDLSQVPKALRRDFGIETVLQLKEIFDRLLLPPLDTVPNAQMIAAARKTESDSSKQTAVPYRWKLPITQIEIVEILEGEQQGQFLFSSATVKQMSDVYKKIKDLPYRQAQFGGIELEYLSPGLSPGFYEKYVTGSGYLLPQAHFMGRLVNGLPEWFKTIHGGQMAWKWTGLLLCVLLTVVAAYAVHKYLRLLAKNIQSPLQDWLHLLSPIIVLLIVVAIRKFIDDDLNFTGDLHAIVMTGIASAVFVLIAWVVFVLFKALAETIIATPRMQDLGSESTLLRIGARVIGFLIAIWILIDGLRELGADLIPLLAGLGIGGLAVALAAQRTIANFIGGLILLANKPVRVGDFCRYGEDPSANWLRIGKIEEINLLSTRIRGIDRTVTTIPNAEFSNLQIVNFTKRDKRLMKTTLHLRYETTAEQIRYILIKIRELLLGHPMVMPEPARARFRGYSDYSKNVQIVCFLRCTAYSEFLAIQEDILLRIEGIIKQAGSSFAFPSQTAYIARDAGLDANRREEAETEVGHRRFTGTLPFPEFDEEEREQLEDILDYPPKGSPGYEPRS